MQGFMMIAITGTETDTLVFTCREILTKSMEHEI